MMDLHTIHELSRQAARKARREHRQPAVPTDHDRAEMAQGRYGNFRIPNLGEYRPRGWRMIDQHFVDKSGFSSPGEPALTMPKFMQLIAKTDPSHGWGMIEEGQFQAWVGEFIPTRKKVKPEFDSVQG